MSGMKVLDVGRASGFFSFEFERRGANVLAVELPSPLQKDFVGGEFTRGIKAEEQVKQPRQRARRNTAGVPTS